MPENPLKPIEELTGKLFRIPNYQRGYKWTPKEVKELLKDIKESNNNELYCLQPLVLTATGDENLQPIENQYDVIDGQQRLSTIYIILSYIDRAIPHFTLSYQTRAGSERFLKNIHQLHQFQPNADEDGWKQYIAQHPEDDNIDNYYFFQAFYNVHAFFGQKTIEEKQFKHKLLEKTAFIWYEIPERHQSSEDIFNNFNAGKIGLTDAELIKAMILLKIQEELNTEIKDLKIAEFAFQWETIEAGLQEKEFWWFLGGKMFSTRMDLLLQLEAGIKPGADDERKVYQRWEEAVKNKEDLLDKWQKIVDQYHRLRDWSLNTNTYHRIGFLTATRTADLLEILGWSNKSPTKSDFKAKLEKEIKSLFRKVQKKDKEPYHPYHIDNLHYVDEPVAVRNTLLWFNVLSYELLLPETHFPFWRYNDPENKWSKEHLHPQSPKDLSTIAEVIQWAEEQIRILEKEKTLSASLKLLIAELSQRQAEQKISPELRDRLKLLADQITSLLELHGIGNMALLDSRTNSALGNRPFFKKREMILDAVETKDDRFIPLTTRNAFCKYYTKDPDHIKVSFWSVSDARDYKAAIEQLLHHYLPEQPAPQTT